jgi:hypothetical protein
MYFIDSVEEHSGILSSCQHVANQVRGIDL